MTQTTSRLLLSGSAQRSKALPMGAKVTLRGNLLSMSLPRCEFEDSATGRTRSVANTGGFKSLGVSSSMVTI